MSILILCSLTPNCCVSCILSLEESLEEVKAQRKRCQAVRASKVAEGACVSCRDCDINYKLLQPALSLAVAKSATLQHEAKG